MQYSTALNINMKYDSSYVGLVSQSFCAHSTT